VLHELHRRLPHEAVLYVADLAWFPYGPRRLSEVRRRALEIVERFIELDTKLVVIACNSATAAALNAARERFDIPIVGVISPGAQAAVELTANGRVAVWSTEATLTSGEYVHAIKEANPGVAVLGVAAPELVDIVESGDADSIRAEQALSPLVEGALSWGADTLVLGCTHYPLLTRALRRVVGARALNVVDSAATTAARVERILSVNRLRAERGSAAVELMVTASPDRFLDSARRLFGDDLSSPGLMTLPPAGLAIAR